MARKQVWRKSLLPALVIALLAVGLSVAGAQDEGAQEAPSAIATLQDVNGQEIGQASFTDSEGRVTVQVVLSEGATLEPGFHGVHLHGVGQCDPAGEEPFASAGTHWTLGDESHPMHTGDLLPVLVNEDGTGLMIMETSRFTVSDLLDEDGTALVIHANADNFANIPERYGTPDEETLGAGDSGARVACGVVMAAEEMPEEGAAAEEATEEGAATEEATEEPAPEGAATPTEEATPEDGENGAG